MKYGSHPAAPHNIDERALASGRFDITRWLVGWLVGRVDAEPSIRSVGEGLDSGSVLEMHIRQTVARNANMDMNICESVIGSAAISIELRVFVDKISNRCHRNGFGKFAHWAKWT